jgi:hypothetical protein
MIATVRDIAALQAVGPVDLAAYLRAKGWLEEGPLGDRGAVWRGRGISGDEYEVLLPLDRRLRDYVARIGDALRTLEAAEERSQLEILSDLTTASADTIRVPASPEHTADGSVPFDVGLRLVEGARDMMLAAACSAVERKAYYPTRKPQQAQDYVSRSLRLGQTERGSYVITVLSRLSPVLQPPLPETEGAGIDDPFERQVTQTLAWGLAALHVAAAEAAATGAMRPFHEAVPRGVSGNLCDAVARMGEEIGTGVLDIRLSWAPVRPAPAHLPRQVVFTPDAVRVIGEAARVFRETTTVPEVQVDGHVVRLDRDEPGEPGSVTVAGMIEGNQRKLRLDLDAETYRRAWQAHGDGTPIRCYGDLEKVRGQFNLRNPHGFELRPDEHE